MNEFDVIFEQLDELGHSDRVAQGLDPTPEELDEIEAIRVASADIVEPASTTYTASRSESADISVHFSHVIE